MKLSKRFNLDFFKIPIWENESLKKVFLNDLQQYHDHGQMRPNNLTNQDEIWKGAGRGNNYGFRDDNFYECADILAAGCSFTWGAGLYEEHVWPSNIKKMTNKTVHNIGVSGGSIYGTISRIFAYIRKFGKPKIIICLFPDAFRSYLPLIPDRLTNERAEQSNLLSSFFDKQQPVLIDTGWGNWDDQTKSYTQPEYSKIPHRINEVVPAEVTFFLAMQQIHILENFCDEAGIKLVWATWHYDTFLFFKKIQSIADDTYFKYFIDISPISTYTKIVGKDELPDFKCHLDLKEEDKLTYWLAADKDHWGSHSQIHIAEIFYEKIKEYL